MCSGAISEQARVGHDGLPFTSRGGDGRLEGYGVSVGIRTVRRLSRLGRMAIVV